MTSSGTSAGKSSPTKEDRFAAFRHAAFQRYWSARFLSTFSVNIVSVAVGWQVYDLTRDPFDLGLVGTASVPVPEIDVRNGKANLNDGKSSINCGKAKVGKKSKPVTLTIANSGTAALTGLKVSVQGKSAKDFKVSQPKLKSLAPGRSTTFKLTFKPKAKGKSKAVLQIGSNDRNENPFDLKLKAKATP